MSINCLAQPPVELAGAEAFMALLVDVKRQIKQLGGVLAGYGAGENEWRPGYEFIIISNLRSQFVSGKGILALYGVPFADYQDEAFASVLDHAGDLLIKLYV